MIWVTFSVKGSLPNVLIQKYKTWSGNWIQIIIRCLYPSISESGKDLIKHEKYRGERLGKKGQELHTSSQYVTTPGFIKVLRYRTSNIMRRRLILPLCMMMLILICYISTQHLQFVSETEILEKANKTLETWVKDWRKFHVHKCRMHLNSISLGPVTVPRCFFNCL